MLSAKVRHYDRKIQIAKSVINDIHDEVAKIKDCRLLIFGLGFDSKMWSACCEHVTFVEDNPTYVALNKDLDQESIVQCKYHTTVASCWTMSQEELVAENPPQELVARGPYDIVLIDGPWGEGNGPGRLLPACWTRKLVKDGGIVYMDDVSRPLETYIVAKMFGDCEVLRTFPERLGAKKIRFSNKSQIVHLLPPAMWSSYDRKSGVKLAR